MTVKFHVTDPNTGVIASPVDYKCGNEHSLFIEQPPGLAIRQFYSWAQQGVIEILGGNTGRPIVVEAWIHDSSLNDLPDLDDYLVALDGRAGEFGKLEIVSSPKSLIRDNCRFIGFRRAPFDGQRRQGIIPAIGVFDPSTYGAWHIAGEFHFYQLNVV